MKITLKASDIARMVDGVVDGDPDVCVSDFARIEDAGPGTLTFLANERYTHYIHTTGASVVLVANDFVAEHPVSATLVRTADPRHALQQLLQAAQAAMAASSHPTGIEQPCSIAPTAQLGDDVYVGAFAVIADGARIGRGVKIYPQCYVGPDAVIGDDTVLYAGVKVYGHCSIGKRCIVHSGAVVGADGFGFAPSAQGRWDKIPHTGTVVIADDVEIGANTTIDRAVMGSTVVGQGTKLDNLVQIGHNVEIGRDTVMAAQTGIAGSAHIGSNCMIAGQVGVAGHIKVGDGTVVGAQSGIPNSVEGSQRLMGYPARPAGEFARQTVWIKRLGSLFDRVAALEKSIDNKK